MSRNIILIGYMGTGKSVIGKRLAKRLNMNFVDIDQKIEELLDMSVAEIFHKYGEVRFRSEERLMISKVASFENVVISTGGGAVMDPENLQVLQKNGVLVHLKTPLDVIYERIKHGRSRPLAQRMTKEDMAHHLEERMPGYKEADLEIDTSVLDVEETVEKLKRELEAMMEGSDDINGS